MSKDHWDAILASAPLNAAAARVTSKGVSFDPGKQFSEMSWDAPPAMVRIDRKQTANVDFVDLTGRRVGRLVVLGLAGALNGTWVCRCSCGRYVGRKSKGLKLGSTEAMCNECDYNRKLRQNASGDGARKRAESEKARKW